MQATTNFDPVYEPPVDASPHPGLEQHGLSEVSLGEYHDAPDDAEKGLGSDPASEQAITSIIDDHEARGEWKLARAACITAVAAAPDNPSLRLRLAWLHFNSGENEAAIEEARCLLERAPKFTLGANRLLVFALGASIRWEQAGGAFGAIERLDENASRAVARESWWIFGRHIKAAIENGESNAAVRLFERLPTQIAVLGEFCHLMREVYPKLGAAEQAGMRTLMTETAGAISRKLCSDPSDAFGWEQLGLIQQTLGHYSAATVSLERALLLDQTLGLSAEALVGCYEAVGDQTKAEEIRAHIAAAAREDPHLRLQLAWGSYNRGDFETAATDALAVVAAAVPGALADAQRLLVFALGSLGRWEEAAEVFGSIEHVDRELTRALARESWWTFGAHIKAALDTGKPGAAVELFERLPPQVAVVVDARHLAQELYAGVDGAGQAAIRARMEDLAARTNRSMQNTPEDAGEWEVLGLLNQISGHQEEAVAAFAKAFTLDRSLSTSAICLAQAHLADNKADAAADVIMRTLKSFIHPAGIRLQLAWLLFEVKRFDAAMEEAKQILGAEPSMAIACLRLIIFSAASCDEFPQAESAFGQLEGADPSAAAHIASESCWTFANIINALLDAHDYHSALRKIEMLPPQLRNASHDFSRWLAHTQSACYFKMKHYDLGLKYYRKSVGRSAASAGSIKSEKDVKVAIKASVVTSLMPRRLSVQQKAIRSWQAYGWEVLSANTAEEIVVLERHFPGVQFAPVQRNAHEELGKPLIYFDDLLEVLARREGEIFGILNSDIILLSDPKLPTLSHFAEVARRSLAFGNRVNSDDEDVLEGDFYLGGYDWFFFGSDFLRTSRGSGLVFGAPWWDFWMPVSAILHHQELVNVRRRFAFHPNHPLGWNEEAFTKLGRRFVASLKEACAHLPPKSLAAQSLHDLSAALSDAGGSEGIDGLTIGRLCQTINIIVESETRWVDIGEVSL